MLQLASKRTSNRYSTYSASPSFATSNSSADSGIAEIKHLTDGLNRLENKRLQDQRFVPTPRKADDLSKLALGAKLERALGRRMTGQDAVMPKKKTTVLSEKSAVATAKA